MAELLASKITVIEEEPRVRGLPTLATAILSIVGISERGPINTPTRTTSFEEYVRIFGSFTAVGEMALAVRQFYLLGGREAWIVRTVHFTDITDPATEIAAPGTVNMLTAATAPTSGAVTGTVAAPFNLEPGDTLVIGVDSLGPDTATFDAAAATLTATNTETYALVDGQTLTVDIDNTGVQTVTFNTAEFVAIGAATALEVAAVMNAELTDVSVDTTGGAPRITTDSRGTDAEIDVTGGTANVALGFATGPNNGTGDVANIDAVTFAEVKTVVEADVIASSGVTVSQEVGGEVTITSNTTGASSNVQVEATSTADDEMGFDNAVHSGISGAATATLQVDGKTDGAYANSLAIQIEDATSGTASEFNLNVLRSSIIVEQFPNLTMDSTLTNFVETVVNDANTGSDLIAGTDLAITGTPTQRRPENTTSPHSSLTGGDDGLTGLADTDFIGDSAGGTGIRAFDTVSQITMLIIPDRPTVAVHNAMITFTEITRNHAVFAILDTPAGLDSSDIESHRNSLSPGTTEDAALYWPQIQIPNPSSAVFGTGEVITVPPSGSIAGVYANNDARTLPGPFTQPAGVEDGSLAGIVSLETDEVLKEAIRDVIFPIRINPITSLPGQGIFLDGARTLDGTGNFPSIGERRGVSDIERVAKAGLEFARNKNNTPELRATVERTLRTLLLDRMNRGAFQSRIPDQAFFIDVSDKLNSADVIAAGQLKVRIGVATNKPAEFIIILVTQDTRALEESLLSS